MWLGAVVGKEAGRKRVHEMAGVSTFSPQVSKSTTYFIDAEFAFYGPIFFDVGKFISNLLLCFFSLDGRSTQPDDRREQRKWVVDSIRDVWNLFSKRFVELWNQEGLKVTCSHCADGLKTDGPKAPPHRLCPPRTLTHVSKHAHTPQGAMFPPELFGHDNPSGPEAIETFQDDFMSRLYVDCIRMAGVSMVSQRPPLPRCGSRQTRCWEAEEGS